MVTIPNRAELEKSKRLILQINRQSVTSSCVCKTPDKSALFVCVTSARKKGESRAPRLQKLTDTPKGSTAFWGGGAATHSGEEEPAAHRTPAVLRAAI